MTDQELQEESLKVFHQINQKLTEISVVQNRIMKTFDQKLLELRKSEEENFIANLSSFSDTIKADTKTDLELLKTLMQEYRSFEEVLQIKKKDLLDNLLPGSEDNLMIQTKIKYTISPSKSESQPIKTAPKYQTNRVDEILEKRGVMSLGELIAFVNENGLDDFMNYNYGPIGCGPTTLKKIEKILQKNCLPPIEEKKFLDFDTPIAKLPLSIKAKHSIEHLQTLWGLIKFTWYGKDMWELLKLRNLWKKTYVELDEFLENIWIIKKRIYR